MDPNALFDLTGGNPFFVSEIVNSPGEDIPQSIRDVVLARAARLDPDSRAVLELAAVAGPALDPALLRSVFGTNPAPEIERCMHLGLLRSAGIGIIFRHALTREIVLAEISAFRRADLSREIAEPENSGTRTNSSALLAHFAEEAGDETAVLRYATSAASEAARLGAHRQAVLQYDRALRFSGSLVDAELAILLEARSFELLVTSQPAEAIADVSRAIALRQQLGDSTKLGDNLRRRSRYHWIAGNVPLAEIDAVSALESLEPGGPTVELAMAYSNIAQLRMLANRHTEAVDWATRPLIWLRRRCALVRLHAMTNIGTALAKMNSDGLQVLDEAEQVGRQLGLHDDVARTFTNRAFLSLDQHDLQRASAYAQEGIAFTDEHDILTLGDYLHALLAVAQLESGERTAPERELVRLLDLPYLGAHTRIVALYGLGLLRARTGRSANTLLDEGLELANRTGEFQRIGPIRAARAEAAWLTNDLDKARAESEAGLALSVAGNPWWNGILALWLERAGGVPDPALEVTGPYRLELDGQFVRAAELWEQLGYPLQQARAMAAEGTIERMRAAFERLQALDARPDLSRVAERLRASGRPAFPEGHTSARARIRHNSPAESSTFSSPPARAIEPPNRRDVVHLAANLRTPCLRGPGEARRAVPHGGSRTRSRAGREN